MIVGHLGNAECQQHKTLPSTIPSPPQARAMVEPEILWEKGDTLAAEVDCGLLEDKDSSCGTLSAQ